MVPVTPGAAAPPPGRARRTDGDVGRDRARSVAVGGPASESRTEPRPRCRRAAGCRRLRRAAGVHPARRRRRACARPGRARRAGRARAVEVGHYGRCASTSPGAGSSPRARWPPSSPPLDAFARRTAPRDWGEALVAAYLGRGDRRRPADRLADALAGPAPRRPTLVRAAGTDAGFDAFAERAVAALREDPHPRPARALGAAAAGRDAGRGGRGARRLPGPSWPCSAAEDGRAALFKKLKSRHAQRMQALGPVAAEPPARADYPWARWAGMRGNLTSWDRRIAWRSRSAWRRAPASSWSRATRRPRRSQALVDAALGPAQRHAGAGRREGAPVRGALGAHRLRGDRARRGRRRVGFGSRTSRDG